MNEKELRQLQTALKDVEGVTLARKAPRQLGLFVDFRGYQYRIDYIEEQGWYTKIAYVEGPDLAELKALVPVILKCQQDKEMEAIAEVEAKKAEEEKAKDDAIAKAEAEKAEGEELRKKCADAHIPGWNRQDWCQKRFGKWAISDLSLSELRILREKIRLLDEAKFELPQSVAPTPGEEVEEEVINSFSQLTNPAIRTFLASIGIGGDEPGAEASGEEAIDTPELARESATLAQLLTQGIKLQPIADTCLSRCAWQIGFFYNGAPHVAFRDRFKTSEECQQAINGIMLGWERISDAIGGIEEESPGALFLESVKAVCFEEGWAISQVGEDEFEIILNEEDETFHCPGCDRDVPWSEGASDKYPDLCDECACKEMDKEAIGNSPAPDPGLKCPVTGCGYSGLTYSTREAALKAGKPPIANCPSCDRWLVVKESPHECMDEKAFTAKELNKAWEAEEVAR